MVSINIKSCIRNSVQASDSESSLRTSFEIDWHYLSLAAAECESTAGKGIPSPVRLS